MGAFFVCLIVVHCNYCVAILWNVSSGLCCIVCVALGLVCRVSFVKVVLGSTACLALSVVSWVRSL